MRRLLPFLLLLAAPAMCWAASDSDPAPKKGACVYARPAATVNVADADAPQARPAVPPAARSTPKAAANGGGSDGDGVMPRTRGNRWHSFLPGMFR